MKPTIKSLENKLWGLCKQIVRKTYPHVCVSCGKHTEGKDLHTGHYFRKKFIPIEMKYDLRLLFPQCSYCNRRKHGNLEWYTVWLLENYGQEHILGIARDIRAITTKKTVPETREFLLNKIQEYNKLINCG